MNEGKRPYQTLFKLRQLRLSCRQAGENFPRHIKMAPLFSITLRNDLPTRLANAVIPPPTLVDQ